MYHGEECALWLKLLFGSLSRILTGQTKWTFVSTLTHQVRGTVLEYHKQYRTKRRKKIHSLHNSVASSNLCLILMMHISIMKSILYHVSTKVYSIMISLEGSY